LKNPWADKTVLRFLRQWPDIDRDILPKFTQTISTVTTQDAPGSQGTPEWFKSLFLDSIALYDDTFILDSDSEILDFGCGIGDQVMDLRKSGFIASGVDINELWKGDFDLYWGDRSIPTDGRDQYLEAVSLGEDEYKLPFSDNQFDLCFSKSTFEHIFNLEEVFTEIQRVLRPGGVSVHSFPSPLNPIEGHIHVPLAFMCRFRFWLGFWALVGKRGRHQSGMSWREVLKLNEEVIKFSTYPSQKTLKRAASKAEANINFIEYAVINKANSRRGKLQRAFSKIGLNFATRWLLSLTHPRVMIWRK